MHHQEERHSDASLCGRHGGGGYLRVSDASPTLKNEEWCITVTSCIYNLALLSMHHWHLRKVSDASMLENG